MAPLLSLRCHRLQVSPRRIAVRLDVRFWVIQAFNGISYGALLFLLASALLWVIRSGIA